LAAILALSFASDLVKLRWKGMNCSEELSVRMPWGEHEHMNGFLDSDMGKLWLKFVSV
jgi:hypothetical protein